ncbi:Acyl-CoA-binding domain-containing protein 5 [Mortierella alpina]|nr:Acyl-CoA-binding domain-containing protein 5 [Mortierella alpina]
MRATQLCALSLATLAMGVQGQTSRPQPAVISDFTFIQGQKLFVGDGWIPGPDNLASRMDQFYALDLTVPWTSDAPAWTRLARRANVPRNVVTAGTMAGTKDGNTVLFFDGLGVFRYNIKTNDWDLSQNVTVKGFHSGATTDTDTGLVYGVSAAVPGAFPEGVPAKVTVFDPATNSFSVQEYDGLPQMAMGGSTIYSSAAKSLYLYESASSNALFKYDITSKAWSAVNATGDIPSPRSAPCFAPAYGGKNLILAGGMTTLGADEVHVFDVVTAEWTKVSNIPLGYYSATCAVSGDSFVLWGGAHKDVLNEDPIVLDMSSGKWGTKFTPGPASLNPVIPVETTSAADRGSRALPIALSAVVAVASILCVL